MNLIALQGTSKGDAIRRRGSNFCRFLSSFISFGMQKFPIG
jgi:hypothetical protein